MNQIEYDMKGAMITKAIDIVNQREHGDITDDEALYRMFVVVQKLCHEIMK